MMLHRHFIGLCLSTCVLGCLAVDPEYFKAFNPDANVDPTGIDVRDGCGVDEQRSIVGTTPDIDIDTRQDGFTNTTARTCASSNTVGHDAFVALDVQAGEYWHFHLQAHPADPDRASRDPAIYVLEEGCNAQLCGQYFSNRCAGPLDEHFAFVAPSTGRWYLGVDDQSSGGGRYRLDAFRPVCGDGVREHGESCDDGMHCDDGEACITMAECAGVGDGQCRPRSGDGCDRRCRKELTGSSSFEALPNDNPVEANVLMMNVPGQFVVQGDVGGPVDCYPDYFAVTVLNGQSINAVALHSYQAGTGTEQACAAATNTPFVFRVTDSAGMPVALSTDDADGCPEASTSALNAGEYFIAVEAEQGLENVAVYTVKVSVVGP